MIMAIFNRTNDMGISLFNLRTLIERLSIELVLTIILFILYSKFKLIFYQIIIRASFFNKRKMITNLNNLTTVKNYNLICIFHST